MSRKVKVSFQDATGELSCTLQDNNLGLVIHTGSTQAFYALGENDLRFLAVLLAQQLEARELCAVCSLAKLQELHRAKLTVGGES